MLLISDPLGLATERLGVERAAHLLRRATFGPSKTEIEHFSTLTPDQAVDALIANISDIPGSGLNAPPPCILELNAAESPSHFPAFGQPFVDHNCTGSTNTSCVWDENTALFNARYIQFIESWWIARMMELKVVSGVPKPSILEKITLFWQNHFVTTFPGIEDYRFTYKNLKLLRNNGLGNFKELVIAVTKDPAMLEYLNGSENKVGNPNENYARELQELFTVGLKDFSGLANYEESDVIAAAKVLSGWRSKSYRAGTPSDIGTEFVSANHISGSKVFSAKYGNQTIVQGTGDEELNSLMTMLLNHEECPKFICRKLYRWFVSPVITQEIEDNVIIPLANTFKGSINNFAIEPIIKILLKSRIFYDDSNVGSMIKSPMDMVIGTYRYFEAGLQDLATRQIWHFKQDQFIRDNTRLMGMQLLQQPTVFGYPAYFQNGYTRNWITSESLGRQKNFVLGITTQAEPASNSNSYESSYDLNLNERVKALQPNFSGNIMDYPAITALEVFDGLTKGLFTRSLSAAQRDILIDQVMMNNSPRHYWEANWNNYRSFASQANLDIVRVYYERLMRHVLQMAEYLIF